MKYKGHVEGPQAIRGHFDRDPGHNHPHIDKGAWTSPGGPPGGKMHPAPDGYEHAPKPCRGHGCK